MREPQRSPGQPPLATDQEHERLAAGDQVALVVAAELGPQLPVGEAQREREASRAGEDAA